MLERSTVNVCSYWRPKDLEACALPRCIVFFLVEEEDILAQPQIIPSLMAK